MLYSFIIRRATPEDAPAVYRILQSAFQEYLRITGIATTDALGESVPDIEREIASKAVYIALIDEEIVGTLRLDIQEDSAYLSRFAVDHQNRNIGIGKALMSVVDKFLTSKGIRRVALHTASRHNALMRFYYGRGFFVESVETDRGYLRCKMAKEYDRV